MLIMILRDWEKVQKSSFLPSEIFNQLIKTDSDIDESW